MYNLLTGFATARLGWLMIGALCLCGCGAAHPSSNYSAANEIRHKVWSNAGAFLPPGRRTFVAADGAGWILTQPFINNSLTLSQISLADGSLLESVPIDSAVQSYAGAGISSDGSGRLWITYGHRLIAFDEATRSTASWATPASPPRLSSTNPLADSAMANAWDSASRRLIFVRNDDQRLFAFDPSTGSFVIASDIPVTTSAISVIAIGNGGRIAITGSVAGAPDFSPAVAEWSGSGPARLIVGVQAACSRSTGLAYLQSTGSLRMADGTVAANILKPSSTRVPFACDRDYVFEATIREGIISVARQSKLGQVSISTDTLIPITVHGINGDIQTYADPGVVGLLPDQTGGVWLISEEGSSGQVMSGAAYPSLAHEAFAT